MNSRATVSIIIPVRNRAALFTTTVQSLTQQTYPNWEALVVDDGSTPEQHEQIAAAVAVDSRVRLLRNPRCDSGACACRNIGVAAATGEYIIFLDSDDALAPDCLAHRLGIIESQPSAAFVAFPSWIFHQEPGDSTTLWNVFDQRDVIERFLHGDSPWQTSGPIWRRSALAQIGPWDVRLKSWQDSEFHIRALITCAHHIAVTEPDAYWRISGEHGSISSSANGPLHVVNRARMLARVGQSLREHGALTRRRRRAISMQLFRHAFRTLLPRRRSLALWQLGRQTRLVAFHEYWLGLFFDGLERAARRLSVFGLKRIYPDFDRRHPAADCVTPAVPHNAGKSK